MAQKNRGWTTVAYASAIAALGLGAGMMIRGNAGGPPSLKASLPALAATTVAAAAAPASQEALRDCLYGISKDICEGRLKGESFYETECDGGPFPCRTFHLDGAEWSFPLMSSNLTCSTTDESRRGMCDELRDRTDGRFKAKLNMALRLQEPCRFRGTLEGEAEYTMNDGSVYKGKFWGLIGSGADRTPACTHNEIRSCENCLDIAWSGDIRDPFWRFGVEVIFEGSRTDLPTGERVRLNISGDFTTPGRADGPDRLNVYSFIGTADGVQTYVCH